MTAIPLGWGATIGIALYLFVMLIFGFVARRRRSGESLDDFYLAGKSLSGFVLLLTLYATQYSGNTLLGYPGEAYRIGFGWIMSVGFLMSVVVVYLTFAPRLHKLAKRFNFVTPGDWIEHRFNSPYLTLTANVLLVVTAANYLLAQLIAMGHAVAGLSDHNIPYWVGVLFLALIIIIYETLGGMRAVAWTDCIQGLMLFVGLLGLLLAATRGLEGFESTTKWIIENAPTKAVTPGWSLIRTWISTVLLVGFAAAVYPQAIQRIYAARNSNALKQSLSIMAFMPLITVTVVCLIGLLGIPHFSNLQGVAADQVMPLLLNEWAQQSSLMYALTIVVLVGVLAAIMSTADSVLLTLSSILAKDFLGKSFMRNAPEEHLTLAGKISSCIIMAILVIIALVPRITLWGLIELKLEILAQVSPVFVIGILWKRLTTKAALAGMISGSVLAIGLTLAGYGKVWGFHAGLLGLCLNVSLCFIISYIEADKRLPRQTIS